MDARAWLQNNILVIDGAMGTMLQRRGLEVGELPELLNLEQPDVVTAIHREYVQAGADVITTNTFQAHELKLGDLEVEEVVTAAVACAKASGAKLVALDVGPLGQLLAPMGTLSFQRAYEIFQRQIKAGVKAGADLIIIETIFDLYEAKAAVLAAKECCDLPVLCTMTFQEDGRTFVGCDPLTVTMTLQGLGVDALGVNCSVGPEQLYPVIETMLRYATVPVMIQANAGIPRVEDGKTIFDVGPREFAEHTLNMVEQGVAVIGGCCGTSPEYIRLLKEGIAGKARVKTNPLPITACTSGTRTVVLDDGVTIIGERLNPTGKKKLKQALRDGNMDYLLDEAIDQMDAGSHVLDVNVGLPELDEPAVLQHAVQEIQGVVNLPLQIDSSDPDAIEAGVRLYNGKPIINSVNGKREVMERIFPIAKKYGALVIGLALDEEGIPPKAEGRLEIARRILRTAEEYGIPRQDILIDCLVLTASAQQEQVMETVRAIRMVKAELGLKTTLGVSNISFGLPQRELLGSVFLATALGAGLDAPIINPLSEQFCQVLDVFRVLNNEDKDSARYIEKYSVEAAQTAAAPKQGGDLPLKDMILLGRKDLSAGKVTELLCSKGALDIINTEFIPALDIVGRRFEKNEIFLPQLMQSAQAVQNGFEVIKDYMDSAGEKRSYRGKILMATVYGDIHDIGKNIVRMLLENYGYEVVDLGKDVPVELVVDTIRQQQIRLAGLSALMTTTVKSMKDTIEAVKEVGLDCTFFVGGAVLNEEYTQFVGADYYARDAMESVAIANRFFEV